MAKKRALITGINGQDGSYLSELLLEQGYEVWGILRRNSVAETQTSRIQHLRERDLLRLEYGDMLDMASLVRVLKASRPDEIYNLAAQSHVRISFDQPIYTAESAGMGTLLLLEAFRLTCPGARFYQAGSSEMFGEPAESPQNERTPLNPVSPYGCAKTFAHHLARQYRQSYGLFISNGILFNHESPRRGENFVTAKVVIGALEIRHGLRRSLALGNLDARRDWGHAKDYVRAMWRMLQHAAPDDFVIATGQDRSVRELVEFVFARLGLGDWRPYITSDPRYLRPTEITHLRGDASKARTLLGWMPTIGFEQLLDEMIAHFEPIVAGRRR
ncbi:MAG: GDP-mannose 4,6-dehydratase [Phycisphaerae bacterium]|nr:GDP-mannose 4,6-dehydratase [Phycisphaerae bacterium]